MPVSLETIRSVIDSSMLYLKRLTRRFGNYTVAGEYPSIPIVVSNGSLFFIPGLKTHGKYEVEVHSWDYIQGQDMTEYKWNITLKSNNVVVGALEIRERCYKTGCYLARIYVLHADRTLEETGFNIYFGTREGFRAREIGPLRSGALYGFDYEKDVRKYYVMGAEPSMRFTTRHVAALAVNVLKNLRPPSFTSEEIAGFENLIRDAVRESLGSDLGVYDMYNVLFYGLEYEGTVEALNEKHFYDAYWYEGKLGYYRIFDMVSKAGMVLREDPAYPYKSKVVGLAEASGMNGGSLFISFCFAVNDPLCNTLAALGVIHVGRWDLAKAMWECIKQRFDGKGIVVPGQGGYSTVRLATALALGAILAGEGKTEWDTVHRMAEILVQLQWKYSGYVKIGDKVVKIYRPDHFGGFLVAYDKIASYGFVPFRNRFVESIIDWLLGDKIMPPEYPGVIPTNAETTLVSVAALMQYAYRYYGVKPSELLRG